MRYQNLKKKKDIRGLTNNEDTQPHPPCFSCSSAVKPSLSHVRFHLISGRLRPSSPWHFFVLMCDLITCLIEVVAAHRLANEKKISMPSAGLLRPCFNLLNKLIYSYAVNYITRDAIKFVCHTGAELLSSPEVKELINQMAGFTTFLLQNMIILDFELRLAKKPAPTSRIAKTLQAYYKPTQPPFRNHTNNVFFVWFFW